MEQQIIIVKILCVCAKLVGNTHFCNGHNSGEKTTEKCQDS